MERERDYEETGGGEEVPIFIGGREWEEAEKRDGSKLNQGESNKKLKTKERIDR